MKTHEVWVVIRPQQHNNKIFSLLQEFGGNFLRDTLSRYGCGDTVTSNLFAYNRYSKYTGVFTAHYDLGRTIQKHQTIQLSVLSHLLLIETEVVESVISRVVFIEEIIMSNLAPPELWFGL